MEHDDHMKVGSVASCWNNPDGSKWIVGKLDDKGMLGHFARNAVRKASNGRRYYTGLSLTHTHTQYANGTTEKRPVEISLCVDPRRDDCRIMFVDESAHETRNDTYKASMKLIKMSDTTATTPNTEAPKEVPQNAEPDRAEMMKVIVEQQKNEEKTKAEMEEQMKKLEEQSKLIEEMRAKAEEDKKFREEIAAKEKLAFEKDVAKSEALAQALVDSWGNTLDQSDLTDSNRESIINMAKKFPRESSEFFRIAHCASKKFAAREQKFKAAIEASKNGALKKEFEAVMNKTTVHAASKKTVPKKTDKEHFMSAFNKYRVGSKGTSLMEEMVNNNIKKRRRMF